MTNEILRVTNLNPVTGKYESGFNPNHYYQITGTGFGSKAVPSYYDNFENRPVGAVGSSVGELVWSQSTGSSIATLNPHSGTKAISHNFALNDFPKVYKNLSNTKQLYFSCWLHFSGTVAAGSVWKFGRVGSGTYKVLYKQSNPVIV